MGWVFFIALVFIVGWIVFWSCMGSDWRKNNRDQWGTDD